MATFGAPSSVVTASPNFPTLTTQKVSVPTAGTPVNLPSLPIPDGASLGLRAKATNGNKKIFLSDSAANVVDPTKRIVLASSESIDLRIQNANAVWIDASSNGAEIELATEQ
jgi:hypothetical protein